jgi:hypothetical protein
MSDFNNEGSGAAMGFHFHIPGILNPLHSLNPIYQAKHFPLSPFHHHHHGHHVATNPQAPPAPPPLQETAVAGAVYGYSPYGATIERCY